MHVSSFEQLFYALLFLAGFFLLGKATVEFGKFLARSVKDQDDHNDRY